MFVLNPSLYWFIQLSFFSVVAEWKFTQNQDILLFFVEANSVCSFPLATGFIWLAYANVFNVLDWFDVLDDDNLPVLTEREVLRNLQAIVTDADKTDKSEVNTFPFPLPLTNYYLSSRSLEVLSVSSRLKIGRSGQVSATHYPKTNITNPVCKSSTMRFSSYA